MVADHQGGGNQSRVNWPKLTLTNGQLVGRYFQNWHGSEVLEHLRPSNSDKSNLSTNRRLATQLPTSPAITLERQSKLTRVSRPFAFGPAWKLEAVAFVTNLGICGFRHKTLSHCLKTVGQVLVGARCRKTQTRVSLVSKIRRALHRSPLRVTRTQYAKDADDLWIFRAALRQQNTACPNCKMTFPSNLHNGCVNRTPPQ